MAPTRIRLRPPGLKPWTKIGTLGPFRGRLGLQWVIAPILVGVILLVVGWLAFFRPARAPGPQFVRVARVEQVGFGAPRAFTVEGERVRVRFDSSGRPDARTVSPCVVLDAVIYRGAIWVDPSHGAACSP